VLLRLGDEAFYQRWRESHTLSLEIHLQAKVSQHPQEALILDLHAHFVQDTQRAPVD
jgi:hypothetical protein